MVSTLGEIKNDVLVQSQANTTFAFYTEPILNNWTNKAHKWAASYKKWPQTEGRSSTTFSSLATNADGLVEGNYPEGWKADSIRKMRIGGKRVDKTDFSKFLDFIEDYSSDNERIFSDFGRVYYINPNIDLSGTVAMWGQYTPADLDTTDQSATTVFSANLPEANEAIVEEIMSYAKKREKKPQESVLHHENAIRILDGLWQQHLDEQYQYGITDTDKGGMFKRMDVVDGGFRDDLFRRDQF